MVHLDRLLEAVGSQVVSRGAVLPEQVNAVRVDSRTVRPGDVFVAVIGVEADGHRFVQDAVARGAAVVVAERAIECEVPVIEVDNSRVAAALMGAEALGRPADSLEIIGVTGTNGKTTTVTLIRHVLNAASDVASLGTLGVFDGRGKKLAQTPPLTTPGPIELHEALGRLRDIGTRAVAMEVSSHALHQQRVAGIEFVACVFTNLTHEHLDYHADLAEYLDTKLSLAAYLKSDGVRVINADVPVWHKLADRGRLVTFGQESEAEVTARDISVDLSGTSFTLSIGGSARKVRLPLVAEFNVDNALAATATAWALGTDPEVICERLTTAPQIPGRMEILHSGEFLILRDYMHTPDSYRRVLATLRKATPGRLIVLFGCGGDRDRKKRPLLAETAGKMADLVVITTDNPRTEDLDRIFADMEEGLQGHAYMKIVDREAAIHRAIGMLEAGDTLLLAGKGHETYQIMGTERVPFDEQAIVAAGLDGVR